jgi:hypothetical protein
MITTDLPTVRELIELLQQEDPDAPVVGTLHDASAFDDSDSVVCVECCIETLLDIRCRFCGQPSEDKSGVCDSCDRNNRGQTH